MRKDAFYDPWYDQTPWNQIKEGVKGHRNKKISKKLENPNKEIFLALSEDRKNNLDEDRIFFFDI